MKDFLNGKRWTKALAMGLVAALIVSLCGFSSFAGECAEIRERVVRLWEGFKKRLGLCR